VYIFYFLHIVENDFLKFPKVKWLQLTGAVSFYVNFFDISHTDKVLKAVNFGQSYFKK